MKFHDELDQWERTGEYLLGPSDRRVPFYGWWSSEGVKFEVNWQSKLPSESEEFDIMGLACGPDGFDDC